MRLSEEIWCVLSRDGVIKKREIIGLFKDNSNQRVIEELSDLFGKIFESGILADDQLVKVLYMKENRIKEIKTPEKKTKSKYTEKQLELDNEMWSALRHRRVLKKEEHIELFNINSTKNVIEELVDLFGNISSSDIVSFEQLGKILEMIENRIIELNKPKSTSPEKKKIPKFTEQQLENEIIRLNPRVILIDSLNFNFDARAKYERQRKKAYQRLFANSYSNVKSKKQKIYVSGKISGIESIAPILFKSAENRLIEDGYEVVNPTTINHLDLDSWIGCMKTDIIELMMCDGIYMLTNWKTSRGAIIELDLANSLGMEVIYETKKDNFKLTDEQIAEKRRIEAVKIAEEKTEKKIKEWSKETGEEDLVRDYFRAQKKLKIIFSQTRNNNRYDS